MKLSLWARLTMRVGVAAYDGNHVCQRLVNASYGIIKHTWSARKLGL